MTLSQLIERKEYFWRICLLAFSGLGLIFVALAMTRPSYEEPVEKVFIFAVFLFVSLACAAAVSHNFWNKMKNSPPREFVSFNYRNTKLHPLDDTRDISIETDSRLNISMRDVVRMSEWYKKQDEEDWERLQSNGMHDTI